MKILNKNSHHWCDKRKWIMESKKIEDYKALVKDLKQLIQEKQYNVLKTVNTETINLYWEIGEEIYKQQQEKGWGKSIV